jgi:hypothetical protein
MASQLNFGFLGKLKKQFWVSWQAKEAKYGNLAFVRPNTLSGVHPETVY